MRVVDMINAPFPISIEQIAGRKSVSIAIDDGKVLMRAPKRMSHADINALLAKKRTWIEKHLAKQAALQALALGFQIKEGAIFRYLGQDYRLSIVQAPTNAVRCVGQTLQVCVEEMALPYIKETMSAWFQQTATHYLTQRSHFFAKKLNVSFSRIDIKMYRRRWGSCHTGGVLRYNWLVIQADKRIIDYLICHELSHLRHMDHSPAFWRCVASVCPEFKTRRAWLKAHGAHLMLLADVLA